MYARTRTGRPTSARAHTHTHTHTRTHTHTHSDIIRRTCTRLLLSETAADDESAGKPPALDADATRDVVVLEEDADATRDVVVLEEDAVVLTDDSAPEPRVMAQLASHLV